MPCVGCEICAVGTAERQRDQRLCLSFVSLSVAVINELLPKSFTVVILACDSLHWLCSFDRYSLVFVGSFERRVCVGDREQMNQILWLSIIFLGIIWDTLPATADITIRKSGAIGWTVDGNGVIRERGKKLGSIDSRGNVRKNGSLIGEIEFGGTIRRSGSKIGSVEKNGKIRKQGRLIGEVSSGGTIRQSGRSWGSSSNCCDDHGRRTVVAVIVFFGGFFN